MKFRRVFFSVFFLLLLVSRQMPAAESGIQVWELAPEGAWARAGVRKGDRIVGWSFRPDGSQMCAREGRFAGPLDLKAVEEELGGAGSFRLSLRRGEESHVFEVPPSFWRVECRPGILPNEEEILSTFRKLLDQRGSEETFRFVQRQAADAGSPEIAAWWWYQAGLVLLNTDLMEEAERYFGEAVGAAKLSAKVQIVLEHQWGEQLGRDGHLDAAFEHLERAGRLISKLLPASLWEARLRSALAHVMIEEDRIDEALAELRKALKIVMALCPASLAEAEIQTDLGNGLDAAGDLAGAEVVYDRALTLRQKLDPQGDGIGISLNDLGIIDAEKGDLGAAEALFERVLLMSRKHGAEDPDVLSNLAMIAMMRGEYGRAADRLEKVLGIWKEENPEGRKTLSAMTNLGIVRLEQGRLDEAEALFRKVISIAREAGFRPALSNAIHSLGDVLFERGNFEGAGRAWKEDLKLIESQGELSLDRAGTLTKLGLLASSLGNPGQARKLHSEALEIRRKVAPGSPDTIESLVELGRVARGEGDLSQAREFFTQAIDLLEDQLGRVGALTDDQARYRAGNMEIYRDLIDVLVQLHRSEEAYGLLESARAWALRNQLMERELVFDADLPEALDRTRLRLETEIERLKGFLFSGELWNPSEVSELSREREALESQRKEVEAQIRKAAPRLSSFRNPKVLDVGKAQSLLDSSSIVLAYSIGEKHSWLFVYSSEGELRCFGLKAGRKSLERAVDVFRGLIEARAEISVLQEAGEALYRLLLEPASSLLKGKTRLIIIPDGPLQVLPFAALSIPEEESPAFLVERFSTAIVDSMSTLSLLKNGPPTPEGGPIVAFVDPLVPNADRGAALRGGSMSLPASRREAAVLHKLFGKRVRMWVGREATRDAALHLPEQTALLHFACHVRLDPRSPLDSAIILASPPAEDGAGMPEAGALPAWEIMERIRLDGALVSLSGCQTALGRRWPGEGLVGLTRAFQLAGARAVLASLWKVEDDSTAELMSTFYRAVSHGGALDESLREAQLQCLHPERSDRSWWDELSRFLDPASSSCEQPRDWAAFTLRGAREWPGTGPDHSQSSR